MKRIPQRDIRGGTANNNKDEDVSHQYALRGKWWWDKAQPDDNERADNESADKDEDEDDDKKADDKSANEDEDDNENASITSTNERKTPEDASITSTNERKTPAMETTCISIFLLKPLTVYFLSGSTLELFVFPCDQDHKALDKRSIKTAYE
jgi:hypothetical protein